MKKSKKNITVVRKGFSIMKCKDVIKSLEMVSPKMYAENWDNVGLLVGSKEKEVKKIMIALDASDTVIFQAAEKKVDMLITHHPMIFSAIKKLTDGDFIGRKIIKLIKEDISYYAMHTNYDVCYMNEAAADKIALQERKILEPVKVNPETNEMEGIGRYGILPEPIEVGILAEKIKKEFGIDKVRITGEKEHKVQKAAISTGAGKSMISYALKHNIEVLITGDIDHHSAKDALEQGLQIIDAGHFGTEHFMTESVGAYLKKQYGTRLEIVIAEEESPFKIV